MAAPLPTVESPQETEPTMSTTATPTRDAEVIASVDRYAEAQRIVDTLSDEGFPVDRVAIVGRDLQLVERVTGRRRYGRAALEGTGSGAVTGALIGAFLALFSLWNPTVTWLGMVVAWTLVGAVVGVVLGLIGQALQRGRRDFSSVSSMQAGTFEVQADRDVADRARQMVGEAVPTG